MVRKKYSGAALAVADEPKIAESIDPSIYHCCKRCARKRRTRYLPEEMVFQFLLHLPAQLLHDVVRHVCREWNLVIRSKSFTYHHLRNLTGGVLIQERIRPRHGFYVEMRRGRLEICKFDCGFCGLVSSSCNGLVVISDWDKPAIRYVANPSTKQWTLLPPFSTLTGHHSDCGIVYVEASMEYKVVRACGYKYVVPKTQIALLTIGVDKAWRHIEIKHLLPPTEREFIYLPMVTGGYVHWRTGKFVLTLNVETEIVCRFSVPQLPNMHGRMGIYLPMGGNLSYIYESGEFSRDVWEMNSVTGEWTMLFSFDLQPLSDRFKGMVSNYAKSIFPSCWLVAREVLVYSLEFQHRCGVAYDVKRGEIQSFELEGSDGRSYHFEAHVNSLVWLE